MEDSPPDYPALRFHPEARLLTWHPTGILDDRILDDIVRIIRDFEAKHPEPFNRFSDMSELADIKVKFGHAFQVAQERREFYKGPRVKSVLFSQRLVGLGMSRMYESLMQDGPIDVRVMQSLEAAAKWLEVPESLLLPPREVKPESK